MITQDTIRDLIGAELVDNNGDKIGKIGQFFLDDQTGEPEWATVNTGFFGTSESFVPLAEADVPGKELRVPYDKTRSRTPPTSIGDGGTSTSRGARALPLLRPGLLRGPLGQRAADGNRRTTAPRGPRRGP